jgi:hypothetical protein
MDSAVHIWIFDQEKTSCRHTAITKQFVGLGSQESLTKLTTWFGTNQQAHAKNLLYRVH